MNGIWSQARIRLQLESLVREEALPYSPDMADNLRGLLALRPEATKDTNLLHLYYVKRLSVNGAYLGEAMFVKDTAALREVPGGIDEPLPRVSSHEIGHAFTLQHCSNEQHLMFRGTTGTNLDEGEIKQARAAAGNIPWIRRLSAAPKDTVEASVIERPSLVQSQADAVALDDPTVGAGRRRTLLYYVNAEGQVVRVQTVADWQKRRQAILQNMQTVMGPLPGAEKRVPLDPIVEEEKDCGDYVRRRLTYASEPNARVPAFLLIPKSALANGSKCPAILSLHSTQSGGYQATAGVKPHPGNEHGIELARRGYVVLAPPYPLLADYHPDLKGLGYQSGTMKAVWDNIRGLDLLESLPFVRTNGFGAIGHSLGGHNSVYTAVFDERIKVVISSCGLDSYVDYMDGNIKGWTSERYMPRLLDFKDRLHEIPFDFHEMIAALAPRACFINAPKGDTNFKWDSVRRVVDSAREVYKLHGAQQRLRVEHPDCGHDFPVEMRQIAYETLDQQLK
jgi:dienelactone hydrolase